MVTYWYMVTKSGTPQYRLPRGLLADWVEQARRGNEALAFEKRLYGAVQQAFLNDPELYEYADPAAATREAHAYFKSNYREPAPIREAAKPEAPIISLDERRARLQRERQLREAALLAEFNADPEETEEHWMEARASYDLPKENRQMGGRR